MKEYALGDIVMSMQGRDIGTYYVIKEVVNENYVLLVDGKTKGFNNPKKKKVKHILSQNYCELSLKEQFEAKSNVQDAQIRKVLKNFKENM